MPGYDAIIRFRCHQFLVDRLERLAARERRDPADFYRIILEDYATEQEKKLGLKPITEAETQQYLRAAEEPVPYKTGQLSRRPAKLKKPTKN